MLTRIFMSTVFSSLPLSSLCLISFRLVRVRASRLPRDLWRLLRSVSACCDVPNPRVKSPGQSIADQPLRLAAGHGKAADAFPHEVVVPGAGGILFARPKPRKPWRYPSMREIRLTPCGLSHPRCAAGLVIEDGRRIKVESDPDHPDSRGGCVPGPIARRSPLLPRPA